MRCVILVAAILKTNKVTEMNIRRQLNKHIIIYTVLHLFAKKIIEIHPCNLELERA